MIREIVKSSVSIRAARDQRSALLAVFMPVQIQASLIVAARDMPLLSPN
jgi:hypothetical protein